LLLINSYYRKTGHASNPKRGWGFDFIDLSQSCHATVTIPVDKNAGILANNGAGNGSAGNVAKIGGIGGGVLR
jgi:hypothetical protein